MTRASGAYQSRPRGLKRSQTVSAPPARAPKRYRFSPTGWRRRSGPRSSASSRLPRRRSGRLQGALDEARAALAGLTDEAQGASFNQPAGQLLSTAPVQASGNYVFPVGGGPAVVSVSHTHHDYPAADIAAPQGTPLYALSDGTVLYTWTGDPRCGTGFTFQATDGQTWTYCHLSYLDPSVQPGTELTAGQPVGLVGATGDATGPHLHLQLQPATSYPQDQQWFESFADTAFQWADAAGTPAGPPVFHIVSLSG